MVERLSYFFFIKNKKIDKILALGLEWLFVEGQIVRVWTLGLVFRGSNGLGLDFGGVTLCPPKGSNSYNLLVIFNPFLWTLATPCSN